SFGVAHSSTGCVGARSGCGRAYNVPPIPGCSRKPTVFRGITSTVFPDQIAVSSERSKELTAHMWQHNYEPLGGSLGLSSVVAAIPIVVLFLALGVWRRPAWMSALAALGSALV